MTQRGADTDLMKRIATGDSTAFASLLDHYMPRLHAYAYRMLGNQAAAEDAVQESFLKLWDQAGKWRPTGTVSAWMYRITHNACIDRVRERRGETLDNLELVDGAARPDETRLRAEIGDRLSAAIDRLPERQRAALLLVHMQEMSGREASEVLEISIEALESLLARARRALRTELAEDKDALMGETGS